MNVYVMYGIQLYNVGHVSYRHFLSMKFDINIYKHKLHDITCIVFYTLRLHYMVLFGIMCFTTFYRYHTTVQYIHLWEEHRLV